MQSTFNNSSSCEAELPEHWEMRIDPRTGLPYYLNHLDQYTTWDDPRLTSEQQRPSNVGSSLRPQQQRPRQASVEPSSSSNRYFSSPIQQDDYFTQSLPRRMGNGQSQPMFRRQFMDDWFGHGFKQFDTDLFEPSWPSKAHTIQRQNPARARSVQPTLSEAQFSSATQPQFQANDCGFPIPVRQQRPHPQSQDVTDNRYEGEHYIIPTQYKRRNQAANKGSENGEAKMKISPTPQPEVQQQQKPTLHAEVADDSNEEAILRRMNSVTENTGSDDIEKPQPTEETKEQGSDRLPTPSVQIVVEEPNEGDSTPQDSSTSQTEPKPESAETPAEEGDNMSAAISHSYEAIEKIVAEVDSYKSEVDEFEGAKDSKQYRYLDEMLTRCQLALDNIETHGTLEVRKKRKDTVNYIESILRTLEGKTCS